MTAKEAHANERLAHQFLSRTFDLKAMLRLRRLEGTKNRPERKGKWRLSTSHEKKGGRKNPPFNMTTRLTSLLPTFPSTPVVSLTTPHLLVQFLTMCLCFKAWFSSICGSCDLWCVRLLADSSWLLYFRLFTRESRPTCSLGSRLG